MNAAREGSPADRARLAGRIGWALYDWANSPFTTLIITFVFAAYFSRGIVGDELRGTTLWGYAIGVSGLTIALASPVMGAIADAAGRRKPWLAIFTAGCVVATALLWGAKPEPDDIAYALVLVVIANCCFEFGIVFNNAMLPGLVARERIGRWSGWAWGLGYAGGLAALMVALVAFVQAERPLFGLDKEAAEHVRVVGPLAALWFAVFVVPLFLFTPDRPSARLGLGRAVALGLATLGGTLRDLPRHGNLARYLIARMIYNDGLATVFAFGGIYAAGAFDMTMSEVIMFGIVLNVTAGLGAAAFAWIDDWLGAKPTVLIALVGLFVTASGAILVREASWFWFWGSMLGIFVGPAQAASRSLMAHLSPPALTTEFFGLYALSGKVTAFMGPLLVAAITEASGSQRWGLSVVLAFFAVGFLLMLTVRAPAALETTR